MLPTDCDQLFSYWDNFYLSKLGYGSCFMSNPPAAPWQGDLSLPVTDPAGRRVSAPDFKKDRQTALAKELLKPKYQVYGFKTAHILKNLSGNFRNPAQIRYEMNKLKARGVFKKRDNQSFYVVT